jgi:hypothetical protein
VTGELNIHIEDPVSTKIVQHNFHEFNIHDTTTIVKSLINEDNAQMRKYSVTTVKHGHQTTGIAHLVWSDKSSLTLLTILGRV